MTRHRRVRGHQRPNVLRRWAAGRRVGFIAAAGILAATGLGVGVSAATSSGRNDSACSWSASATSDATGQINVPIPADCQDGTATYRLTTQDAAGFAVLQVRAGFKHVTSFDAIVYGGGGAKVTSAAVSFDVSLFSSPVAPPTTTPTPTVTPTTAPPSPTPTPTDSTTPPPAPGGSPGAQSGLAWMSGAAPPNASTTAELSTWCTWRGTACDVGTGYTLHTWDGITGSNGNGWIFTNFAGFPGTEVLSIPLIPDSGATLATCATGGYNAKWTALANNAVANGRGTNLILRLGWEGDGTWFAWTAGNTTASVNAYKACWNQAASTIKAIAPGIKTDWTVTKESGGTCLGDVTNCYPGSANLDYIGIDSYNQDPAACTTAQLNADATAPGSIQTMENFAVAQGKGFGVGEWGVSHTSPGGCGDNPAYIDWMHNFFVANAARSPLYESYFDNCDAGNVESGIHPGCTGANANTASAAKYAADF